jgi:hypothetical protein
MNLLKSLIKNNTIKYISNCEDYIQVFFINGAILNLYSKVKTSGDYNSFNYKTVNKYICNKKY